MNSIELSEEISSLIDHHIDGLVTDNVQRWFLDFLMNDWENKSVDDAFTSLSEKVNEPIKDLELSILYLFNHLVRSGKIDLRIDIFDDCETEIKGNLTHLDNDFNRNTYKIDCDDTVLVHLELKHENSTSES